tara:strand:- start:411 stop:1118 length:708 start_codon:yes stop_codon:yes gene_type:complete
MARFGWAYIDCADTGSIDSGSAGPPNSIQFVTESGGSTTGSYNLTYYTASYLGHQPSTLLLSGNLFVTGTISASTFHIEDIAIIDATGSTYFGDSLNDTHQRSGSVIVTAETVRSSRAFIFSASTAEERVWVRGFGGFQRTVLGANIFLQPYDYIVGCSGSGNQTLYLPTASVVGAGAQLVIKDQYNNRAATSIYISSSQHTAPHQKIDDEAFYHLTGTMPAISLFSDGTNWFVY